MLLKKRLLPTALFLCSLVLLSFNTAVKNSEIIIKSSVAGIPRSNEKIDLSDYYKNQYASWNLAAFGIAEELFAYGITGFNHLIEKGLVKNSRYLTLIDYSKPSSVERLFVLDILNGKVLFKTLVAHGKNSGTLFANSFSNQAESHESSPGFFITDNTYEGKNGYSLVLKGCEKGINDNAQSRAIVMHGAPYVSNDFVSQHGFLGRSHGCPAIPFEVHEQIINTIKNGTWVFAYAPIKKYLNESALLQ